MLTDAAIKSATCPHDKTFKRFSDSENLYLEVRKNGGKYWFWKYRIHGTYKLLERRLALGPFPNISKENAREKRNEARKLLSQGQDPSHVKKMRKRESNRSIGATFKEVALEWHKIQKPRWSKEHGLRIFRQMERDLFPWLGARPIKEITGNEILFALRKVEDRGAIETADRDLMVCRQIWEYVALDGISDATRGIKSKLKPYRGKKYPAIVDPLRFAHLLRAIARVLGHLLYSSLTHPLRYVHNCLRTYPIVHF